MINRHQFQKTAKSFRAGRISLQQFTDTVFRGESDGEHASPSTQGEAQVPAIKVAVSCHANDAVPQLPPRKPESHKGDFGRVVMVGGSAGMAGAISLSGLASLKSGSGLVKVAVPKEIQTTVASYSPCYMTVGCLSENGEIHGSALAGLIELAAWSDVVGLGPGLDRGPAQQWIVPQLYEKIDQPMVVDADGLNALVDAKANLGKHAGQRVLTPHPGEFQRLIGDPVTDRKALEERAVELASERQVVIVLKGHRTWVTDGEREFRNTTGNPGMATPGAGDVLTGVLTSFVGQGLSLFDAAVLAVYLHGLAGDLAAETVGQTSLTASDLIDFLPDAILSHTADSRPVIGFSGGTS
jgi:ADP-dependent NAD(P)H-hydrate dehydratase